MLSGWLNIDKPLGITSARAVDQVKRLLPRGIKIGHGGTLDPQASGVLPIAIGEATKTVAFAMDKTKTYEFEVTFGESRDTDDAEGQVTETSAARPTPEQLEAALPQFTGKILQRPPAYSALKIDGKRAYALARAGEAVELEPREVFIEQITLLGECTGGGLPLPQGEGGVRALPVSEFNKAPHPNPPPWGGRELQHTGSFRVTCGKGTYIRSLARDIATATGCLGYVSCLRRTHVGPFAAKNAISLENLEEIVHKHGLDSVLHPVESMLDDIPAWEVSPQLAARLKQGQDIPGQAVHPLVRAQMGTVLIALCEPGGGRMKPVRVFNLSDG